MDITGILAFGLLFITIRSAHLGLKYDIEKEKIDKGYKKNHFLNHFAGKLTFVLPITITDKTNNEKIQKLKKAYNINVYLFWILLIILLITYWA